MLKQFTESLATAFTSDPLKDYKLNLTQSFSGGRGNVFSVTDAVVRKTGKAVSVFSIKRKNLLAICGGEAKLLAFVGLIQRGVSFLKVTNHPFLLDIEKEFTDSGSLLFFVTERIIRPLSLEHVEEIPLQLRKLELQHLLSSIRFLHERCHLLLLNFSPHLVYLTTTGWKIGDLSFALLPEDLPKFSRINNFSSITSPDINYLADECLTLMKPKKEEVSSIRQSLDKLFEDSAQVHSSASESPSLFPHSDIFSFVVTAVEVLQGKKLFTCRPGDVEERQRQIPKVQKEVSHFFPVVESLSSPLRPPLSSISQASSINGDDIRILLDVEKFSVNPSESVSFDTLKSLYHGIGSEIYCNEVLLQVVLPFAFRAAKQQRMLRFVLPIIIQSAGVLAPKNKVPKEIKDFLTTVIEGIIREPSFEMTEILAQQLLQKIPIIQSVFPSETEDLTVFLPLYSKCLASTNESLQILSMRALNDLIHKMSSSYSTQRSTSVKLPDNLLERLLVLMEHGSERVFSLVLETTTTLLVILSPDHKAFLEIALIGGLKSNLPQYPKRVVPILTLLYSLQQSMSLEHTANSSIPLLSSLLLSSSSGIRNYAASMIFQRLSVFDAKIDKVSMTSSLPTASDALQSTDNSAPVSIHTSIYNDPCLKQSVMSPSFNGFAGGSSDYQEALKNSSTTFDASPSQTMYDSLFSKISNPSRGSTVPHVPTHAGGMVAAGVSYQSSHPLLDPSSASLKNSTASPSYSSTGVEPSFWSNNCTQ